MQEKLVLFFSINNTVTWVAGDEVSEDSDKLLAVASDRELIAIVPAEDVLLTSIVLPKLNRTRLMQALPFALEDQLATDIEKLHFAPASFEKDGTLAVAVVAHEKMQQWQEWLRDKGLQVESIYPATCTLPAEENTWHIAITNTAIVRTDTFAGFSCEVAQLATWLNVALGSAQKKPNQLIISNYSAESINLSNVDISVTEHMLPPKQWYKDAVKGLDLPTINLLSGNYALHKNRFSQMAKTKRVISYLTAAWLGLLLLYPLVSYVMLKARLSSIQSQMWHIYKGQFPNATTMATPKIKFEEKLHKAGSTLAQNRFLLLLGTTGEALHHSSDVMIKRLDYQGNLLTLDLTAPTASFSTFTHYLSQQGFQVKQQNASVTGDHVSAMIQVE